MSFALKNKRKLKINIYFITLFNKHCKNHLITANSLIKAFFVKQTYNSSLNLNSGTTPAPLIRKIGWYSEKKHKNYLDRASNSQCFGPVVILKALGNNKRLQPKKKLGRQIKNVAIYYATYFTQNK